MIVGGLDNAQLMYGAGSVVGSGGGAQSFAAADTTSTSVLAANGGGATDRQSALLAGAAPVTDAERRWVQAVEGVLRQTLAGVQALVNEARRQAALGRDINGNPFPTREESTWEQRVTDLVNAERAKYGLGALRYNRQLDAAAEGHNAVQAATGTMAHEGIGDGDPGGRIQAQGFNLSWGENVATGQLSPEQVVAEWMASPGHRRNILDPNFGQIGVSYTQAANGRTFWAQSFGAG